jgi:hypothetical protein
VARRRAGDSLELAARVRGEAADPSLDLVLHDQQQIELRHTLPLAGIDREGPSVLDLYFFVPRNIGVSAQNYPRDEFYGDLNYFMRIDVPPTLLDALADDRAGASPLVSLRRSLERVGSGDQHDPFAAVSVKLFGHLFTESVLAQAARLSERLRAVAAVPSPERWVALDEVDRFGHAARAALHTFRGAQRRFEPFAHAFPVLETFRATDEYASLYLDSTLAQLIATVREAGPCFDGQAFPSRLEQVLARHARAESRYRAEAGFLNLRSEDTNGEYFTYRFSTLKKAVQQALYVDSGRLHKETFIRNATGLVAAGLAATWAVVAQLPQRVQNLPPFLQSALVALPIVAYMAKDRIKELVREWLTRRIRGYDHELELRAGALSEGGLGELTGVIRETTRFTAANQLPPAVRRLRAAQRTVAPAGQLVEGVLHHRRMLRLENAERAGAGAGFGFRQIVRLNLRHFLTRLDDPEQRSHYYSADRGRFLATALPKVYHLNLVVSVSGGANGESALRRWRIVLNKQGIVRIERVVPR